MSVIDRLPRAVIFDWDNTLVDTWPVIHDSMNATLAAMGHRPWSLEETRERVRRSMREAFPAMFGSRWEEARAIFYRRFDAIHLERLAVCEGAEQLVSALAGHGICLSVVSNKMGRNLRREADHLGWAGYFFRLVGASDARRDKPATEPVDLALSGSGVARGADVWFVGDTSIDLECAHNAGCTGILVRREPPRCAEFGEYPPDAHFARCTDLRRHVEDL